MKKKISNDMTVNWNRAQIEILSEIYKLVYVARNTGSTYEQEN